MIRKESNNGIMLYAIGLPFISYLVKWISDSPDSTLGISILSICFLNIFYAPVQFIWDQKYYEGFFSKKFSFGKLIVVKLLFLQIACMLGYLIVLPLSVTFYDIERILLITSFLFYCLGFAVPLAMLISGMTYYYEYNSFNIRCLPNRFKLRYLILGLIPFVPEVGIIIIFYSRIKVVLIMNLSISIMGLLSIPMIIRAVYNKIIIGKYLI